MIKFKIEIEGKILQISTGFSHTMVLCQTQNEEDNFWEKLTIDSKNRLMRKSKKTLVYIFGDNTFGQLGLKDFLYREKPVKLETNIEFKRVACGFQTSAGISVNGELYIWGNARGFGLEYEEEARNSINYPRIVRSSTYPTIQTDI